MYRGSEYVYDHLRVFSVNDALSTELRHCHLLVVFSAWIKKVLLLILLVFRMQI